MSRTRSASPPVWVGILALIGLVFLALPIAGLALEAPWSQVGSQLVDPTIAHALELSLGASLMATSLSVLLGVPLAWALARMELPARSWVRGIVTLPLVLPPVVGGVALLLALGRIGLIGRPLNDLLGITLFGTPAAVVIAETFVAMPFLVIAVEGALRTTDRRYEEAAATLGARPGRIFTRVTLPLIAPSLGAGAVLAWARALGEFGATITFAGNLPGSTQTVPLAVYVELQHNLDGAISLSLVLVGVSLGVLVVLRDRWMRAL